MERSLRPAGAFCVAAFLLGASVGLAAAPVEMAAAPPSPTGACVPSSSHLCFFGGDFEASLRYQTQPGDSSSSAVAVQPADGRPGYFRFGDVNAAEFFVEVLDHDCTLANGHFWISALPATANGWVLTVTYTPTGEQATYSSPFGTQADPIADRLTFECAAVQVPAPQLAEISIFAADLGGGRFRAEVRNGPFKFAGAIQVTRDSGVFSLYGQDQDLLVKIFEPADTRGFYGVAGASGFPGLVLEITDLCTGNQRSYTSTAAYSFADGAAFPAGDDSCGLFYDGFENGSIAAWSATPVP